MTPEIPVPLINQGCRAAWEPEGKATMLYLGNNRALKPMGEYDPGDPDSTILYIYKPENAAPPLRDTAHLVGEPERPEWAQWMFDITTGPFLFDEHDTDVLRTASQVLRSAAHLLDTATGKQ